MSATTRRKPGARLVRRGPALVAIDVLAADAGVHPELARRLVQMGLLEPSGGSPVAPLFSRQDSFLIARAMRLRRDLGVNVAGAVLASELLTRIDELERRLRAGAPRQTQHEVIAWTRTA
jgi:hypothetical protein